MKTEMPYRFLGNTGLKVSAFSFGNWANSVIDKPGWSQELTTIVNRAIQLGINSFDTAEYYGYGLGETQFGHAFAQLSCPRKDIVVTTKFMWGGHGVNDTRLSIKHLNEACTLSLQRLKLDYVDVVYAHRYDPNTPMEEICRGFNRIIDNGCAFYWGTSKWTPMQIVQAYKCCEKYDLIKPVVEQPEYNLLVRENVEKTLVPLYDEYKLGTTVWSPLAGGILTGKYISGDPEQSRFTGDKYKKDMIDLYRNKYKAQEEKTKGLVEYSKEIKYSPAQICLAWVLKNNDVSSCILGCSNVKQLEENIRSLELYKIWSPKIEERVNSIFNNTPMLTKACEYRRQSSVKYT